ncbi:phosphatase PAP2 family protein [Legionella cherrii]|nr:phosphatase PAP2 family protein [Legionella cherrii]
MSQVSSRSIMFFAGLILALSSISFLINSLFYNYPGNNYFPEGIPYLALTLILMNLGLFLYFPQRSKFIQAGRELIYLFMVMSVVAIATNAVQLTPFPAIDHYIVSFEKHLSIHMEKILIWTDNHPHFKYVLGKIYDTLPYQMSILPMLIIITCRFHLIREYYFYMLSTVLIGFVIYYFFPTTAPASVINSPLFSPEQIDTGLKFKQIHHYINPTTNEGGLIALPSFHTIWAILCVNLLREWPIPYFMLMIINVLLISSCVLLGWHYVTDIVAALIILLISHLLLKYCSCDRSPFTSYDLKS